MGAGVCISERASLPPPAWLRHLHIRALQRCHTHAEPAGDLQERGRKTKKSKPGGYQRVSPQAGQRQLSLCLARAGVSGQGTVQKDENRPGACGALFECLPELCVLLKGFPCKAIMMCTPSASQALCIPASPPPGMHADGHVDRPATMRAACSLLCLNCTVHMRL